MSWLVNAARLLEGGPANLCMAEHPQHETVDVHVRVANRSLALRVYDPERYRDTPGYCTGDDDVSRTIGLYGVWEPFGTALVSAILADDAHGAVIDLGAHVGWYSLIAAAYGHGVLAVDADAENLALLERNARANGLDVVTARAWIGADAPTLPQTDERIRLVKSDLEGNEQHAVRVLSESLGLVDYFLLEVSPCFADHYPDTLAQVLEHGYAAFLVPDEGLESFVADPLDAITAHPLDLGDVPGLVQRDVLLIHEGVL